MILRKAITPVPIISRKPASQSVLWHARACVKLDLHRQLFVRLLQAAARLRPAHVAPLPKQILRRREALLAGVAVAQTGDAAAHLVAGTGALAHVPAHVAPLPK